MKAGGCNIAIFQIAILLLLAMTFSAAGSPASQPNEDQPYEEWNRTFGGPYGDGIWSAQEAIDGGYLLVGYTSNRGQGSDLWLIKTDIEGRDLWNRIFGGSGEDVGYFVQNTKDGGSIIAGSTKSYGVGEERLWLLKADSNGSKQWDRTFGGFVSSVGDGGWAVNETDDDGYIITGYTKSNGAGGKDLWLIKADSAGTKQWDKTFGGSKDDVGMSVIQSADGGYVAAGRTASYGSGKDDIWLLKTDSEGQERWNRTFGGAKDDVGFQVLEVEDGYALVGRTESGREGKRAILIRTDLMGSKTWEKTYREGSAGISVQKSSDDGFVISGGIDLPNADKDAILIKTDSSGREEWSQILGGSGEEIGSFVLHCKDGNYLLAGITDSFGSGAEDAWLIKLRPITNQGIEALSRGDADAKRASNAEINTAVDITTNTTATNTTATITTAANATAANTTSYSTVNTTAEENVIDEPIERAGDETSDTQNIFKQKRQSFLDVFSGPDLRYKPLRPLPKADLLRRTGQSA
jgi:hypothetical protein